MAGLLLDLYKKMLLIREAEAEIRKEYHKNQMKTPMHMSLGQEAIAAGVCHALPEGSHAFGTYRSHALYIAMTGEVDRFFGEMYGRATGSAGGKAGSMHLASPEHGLIATSAVVGTTLPWALGDAFEARYNYKDRITVVFFGDGATDEGVFWETLNAACLWRLPLLFICEDNNLAIHTSTEQRRGYDSLPEIVSKFRCTVFEDTGNDAEKVYTLTKNAIFHIIANRCPSIINLNYYRYLEHVGVNEDFDAGYRRKVDFSHWLADDPINSLQRRLLKLGCLEQTRNIEKEIREKVLESRMRAEKAPFPEKEDLIAGVFRE